MKNIYLSTIALACLFFFTISLLICPVKAQFWEPLPGNVTLLYTFQHPDYSNLSFFAAHADSVLSEGADSAYYLYRIDRYAQPSDTQLDCSGMPVNQIFGTVLVNQDHYLGRKMLKSINGDCRFISSIGDTFLLKTTAATGNSWTWNGNITAHVDSVIAGQVLGVADSLKYITLSSGNHLVLSRTHGLTECFSFLPFSTSTSAYPDIAFSLWGIPAHGLGGKLPHYGDIFQFDPNDRFGRVYGDDMNGGMDHNIYNQTIQTQTPGSRFEYSINGDRMHITDTPFTNPDSVYYPPVNSSQTYDSLNYLVLNLLPYQHNPFSDPNLFPFFQDGFRYMDINNGRIEIDFWRLTYFDTCAMAQINFEGIYRQRFAAGLGEIEYSYSDVAYHRFRQLYCYEKGLETWGNCLDLGTLIGVQPSLAAPFKMGPNPASSILQIQLDAATSGLQRSLVVTALDGRELRRIALAPSESEVDITVRDLDAGLYLLGLEADGFRSSHQRFAVAR